MQPSDSGTWNERQDMFTEDFFSLPASSGRGSHDLYTDFSQAWPDPWKPPTPFAFGSGHSQPPFGDNHWPKGPSVSRERGPRGRGGPGKRGSKLENIGRESSRYLSPTVRAQNLHSFPLDTPKAFRKEGTSFNDNTSANGGHQWNHSTKQFGNDHFHRNSISKKQIKNVGSSKKTDIDVFSNFVDGTSGRKRPRSLDRESTRQISKSSRAENVTRTQPFAGISLNGSRAQSLTDLSSEKVKKPDSTCKSKKSSCGSSVGSQSKKSAVKGPNVIVKKKAGGLKKSAVTGFRPTTSSGVSADCEQRAEGVLEKAERICRELREKRQQAGVLRTATAAASSSQRVALLKNAINSSARHFNSVHKSFIKGYFTDGSNLAPSTATSDADSGAAQNPLSSSNSSADSVAVASTAGMDSASTSTSNTDSSKAGLSVVSRSSSQMISDIERLRHSIESSVMADKGRMTAKEKSASLEAVGKSSAAPTSSVSSRVPSSLPGATLTSKPPMSLSKEALTRMLNAPRSRTQRIQLARILRKHSTFTASKPRRIQLDGVYDHLQTCDGDSIHDVLRNCGLEEIGDCVELQNVKLEDLTSEDKLRIAQLIEAVDVPDRAEQPHLPGPLVAARRQARRQSSNVSLSDREQDEPTKINSPTPPSPVHCIETLSCGPSQPLSLHDLDTDTPTEPSSRELNSEMPAWGPNGPQHAATPAQPGSSPARVQAAEIVPDNSDTGTPGPSRDPEHYLPSESIGIVNRASQITDVVIDRQRSRLTVDNLDCGTENQNRRFGSRVSERHSPSPVRPSLQMEVSEAVESSIRSVPTETGSSWTTCSAGVVQEVLGICQQHDSIMSQMRLIDVDLSQMYKSLIEIVARMSSLQRKRVALQSEGEQLSQRRNKLLSGLLSSNSVSLHNTSFSADVSGTSLVQRNTPFATATYTADTVNHIDAPSDLPNPAMGSSVTLPQWLSASVPFNMNQTLSASSSIQTELFPIVPVSKTSDTGFPGPVTILHGSNTLLPVSGTAASHREGARALDGGLGTSATSGSSSAGAASSSLPSVISLGGVLDAEMRESVEPYSQDADKANKVTGEVESSSGMGSSLATVTSSQQQPSSSSLPFQYGISLASDYPATSVLSSSVQKQPATSLSQMLGVQTGRFVFNSFGSPPHYSQTTMQPPVSRVGGAVDLSSAAGVSVAYLGSLSSELVQQIVRNLPLTSQLGEVRAPPPPPVFVLNTSTVPASMPDGNTVNADSAAGTDVSVTGRLRSSSADSPSPRSRIRTTSLHSVSSGLRSGEHQAAESCTKVPCLDPPTDESEKGGHSESDDFKLWKAKESSGSKGVTPRSESDVQDCSSASLGEQIKLFSERNTSSDPSSLSFFNTEQKRFQDMNRCSVVLQRLHLPENKVLIINDWQAEMKVEDSFDRPRRRKTKKDRDQSLQRRRQYVADTTSEDEGDEAGSGLWEDKKGDAVTLAGSACYQPGSLSLVGGGAELVGGNGEQEPILVDSDVHHSQGTPFSDADISNSRPVNDASLSPSLLKLKAGSMNAFRASVAGLKPPARMDALKFCGPCDAVMGLVVHRSLLYAGFQGIGVNSYTLEGQLANEFPLSGAQCFTFIPANSDLNESLLAIGAYTHVEFYSAAAKSLIQSLNTVSKVLCMQLVDSRLHVGLDTGIVAVITLTNLQVTQSYQVSDYGLHAMTWTREGSTRLLCIASQDALIHVVDTASGLPVRIIRGHSKTAFSLCIANHLLISGSGDKKVMAHNVHTSALVWELQDHKSIVTSVCVDNGLLFSGGYDQIIRCYDFESHKFLHLLYGAGKNTVTEMSVYNSILYTGNRDGLVEAIDLRGLGAFECHCKSCGLVYGLKDHLWHHMVADHLMGSPAVVCCPWNNCDVILDTASALANSGEHMRSHIGS